MALAPTLGAQSGTALLVGSVLADSSRLPIEGAEVSVPGISKRTLTVASGRFRIDGVSVGTHEVIVRYVGFSPHVMHIAFAANDSVEREMLLRPVPRLEPVNVQASMTIPSFEEHRRVGLGTFLTRPELEKQEGRKLSEILGQVRGIRLIRGSAGAAYLSSGPRPVTSLSRGAAAPSCYAQVFLDQTLVYRGEPREPLFDINSVSPVHIEAIEYYSGPGSTPLRYSRLNSQCGVIVIHTRRTP